MQKFTGAWEFVHILQTSAVNHDIIHLLKSKANGLSMWKGIPDPAVSVPSAKLTRPAATAAAEPEDEPPGTNRSSKAFGGVP